MEFVHNIEALGLPLRKAALMAGLAVNAAYSDHVIQAREIVRNQIRGKMALTKEDVLFGIRDAIDRARIISEPATEIAGWKQISTMLGYDAPTKIDINMRQSVVAAQQQVKGLSDSELVDMLGAGSVIDGEFYEVKPA